MVAKERGIVYYSQSGNTREGARQLAEKLKIDTVVGLEENKNRNGFLGFIMSGFEAMRGVSSELKDDPCSGIAGLKNIIVMTPIWAGKPTPAINAFLERVDFHGTKVTVVTLQSDPNKKGIEKAQNILSDKVTARGGTVTQAIALFSTKPRKFAGAEHIGRQIDQVVSEIEK